MSKPEDYLARRMAEAKTPQEREQWEECQTLFKRKLWFQLTQFLSSFIESPIFEGGGLLELYESFIKEFAVRMNQLDFVKIMMIISTQLESPEKAIEFLGGFKEQVKEDKLALICLHCAIAELHLRVGNMTDVKSVLKETNAMLDELDGVSEMHASYYRVSAEYNKICGNFDTFYTDALRFLGCVDLEMLSIEDKVQRAFDLGLAALLSQDVYNFGELLNHDIMSVLDDTDQAWVVELLRAFNFGNLAQFHALQPQWEKQADLAAHTKELEQKIALLAIMELVFQAPAHERSIPFSTIAETTHATSDQVEPLVMKALAKGLVRGYIDQVEQCANLHWVQPRVLNLEQVATMRDRFATWLDTVKKTTEEMKKTAPELLQVQ